jgi:hypothetical protein
MSEIKHGRYIYFVCDDDKAVEPMRFDKRSTKSVSVVLDAIETARSHELLAPLLDWVDIVQEQTSASDVDAISETLSLLHETLSPLFLKLDSLRLGEWITVPAVDSVNGTVHVYKSNID